MQIVRTYQNALHSYDASFPFPFYELRDRFKEETPGYPANFKYSNNFCFHYVVEQNMISDRYKFVYAAGN